MYKMIKMFVRCTALLAVTFLFPLAGQEDELFVLLETENQLLPIAIQPFSTHGKEDLAELARQLEKVLRFDFSHNGQTFVLDSKEEEALWELKPSLENGALQVEVKDFRDGSSKTFDVPLAASVAKDRAAVHRLSDAIHEYLFGIKGIAASKILYTVRCSREGKERSDIWECDYDGENARPVIASSGYCVTPQYIPPLPGKLPNSCVFVCYKTGQPKIYCSSLQQERLYPLLSLSGNQLMPTVAKQRNRLAFISDVAGNPDLFIQEFDPEKGVVGKPRHLFTAYGATQGTPSFSPDGTLIAFVSNKSGTPRIYLLKIPPPHTSLKEMHLQLISKFTTGNTAPSWSPDGTKIAYCAKINGVHQIMVYDLLTGSERQLTEGALNKENPSFAKNSQHLAYNTSDAGNCELYLIHLKQAVPLRLTTGEGDKRFPHFEP